MDNKKKKRPDLRAPRVIRGEARQKRILDRFAAVWRDYPELSPNRAVVAVANETGLTTQGVKYILIKAGVYRPGGDPIVSLPR